MGDRGPTTTGTVATQPPPDGPELVFAVVCPVGTPSSEFFDKLSGHLHSYGYTSVMIKLSGVLVDSADDAGRPTPTSPEDARINALMSEGDALCRDAKQAAAVALWGIGEVREYRARHCDKAAEECEAVPRTAYVLDSVKRPAEVTQLRQIYGNRLVVVGLQSSAQVRRETLADRIRPQRATMVPTELDKIVDALIERDLEEADDAYGQNTLKTFPMADVFVEVDTDPSAQIGKMINLLFGCPEYEVPSDEEFGMNLAFVSSSRTAELGLKVGAALMVGRTLIGLGVNEHPKPTGAPSFDSSAIDIRALLAETLSQLGGLLKPEEKSAFDEAPDTYVSTLLSGQLGRSSLKYLTEFQPTVHAEMSAVLDAMRLGAPISGATMYVTAYPCHNCAKHLIALDLEVKYLEPYPKSRAASMYGPSVEASFSPFTGIAPRRYPNLFEVTADRKSADGTRLPWGPAEKNRAQPRVNLLIDHRGIADREVAAVSTLVGEEQPSGREEDHQA